MRVTFHMFSPQASFISFICILLNHDWNQCLTSISYFLVNNYLSILLPVYNDFTDRCVCLSFFNRRVPTHLHMSAHTQKKCEPQHEILTSLFGDRKILKYLNYSSKNDCTYWKTVGNAFHSSSCLNDFFDILTCTPLFTFSLLFMQRPVSVFTRQRPWRTFRWPKQ